MPNRSRPRRTLRASRQIRSVKGEERTVQSGYRALPCLKIETKAATDGVALRLKNRTTHLIGSPAMAVAATFL